MRFLLIMVSFFSLTLNAQSIFGNIVNENGKPIEGVSVYIDGSAKATQSDTSGNFEMMISNLKLGNLVFKKEGYETIIHPFNANKNQKLKVILSKETLIEEVKLLRYSDRLYDRFIHRFLDEFLGSNRDGVTLKNPKVLIFAFDKEQNIIRAKAKKPLLIENRWLGYTIEYNLISFAIDNQQKMTTYTGTSFFKPMKGGTKNQRTWHINRLNAYYGSAMHFFRSAYHQQLDKEGFICNRIVKIPNKNYPSLEEQQMVENFRTSFIKSNPSQIVMQIPNEISDIQSRMRKESPYPLALTEHKVPIEKLITKNDNETVFHFEDLLGVVYPKYTYRWVNNKVIKSEIPIHISPMIETNGKAFILSREGNYTDPDQMLFHDDWAKDKLQVLLPLDYEVEE